MRRAPLPPRVRQLGWISFFADVCSEMVYPVIPLFLRGPLRAPAAALGLIEGVSEAIVSVMKGWSGLRSDRTGRRSPFIQWGYALSAAGKPMLAAAQTWPFVLVGRAVDRYGKGIRTTARDAMIADSVERRDLGRAFGFHRAMDTAGALVGVFVGLGLLALMPGRYREIFVIAAIPGAIAVLIAMKLRDVLPDAPDEDVRAAPIRRVLAAMPAPYWAAFWTLLLFSFANSSDMLLLARAGDIGVSDTAVILAYALYNVVYMVLSYTMGSLSDRVGEWPVVGAAWLLYAGVYFGFAKLSPASAIWTWPLFALYGLYQAMSQGATKALVARATPPELRGSGLGIFYMASGLATLVGNLAAGFVWDRAGAGVAFAMDAGVALVAALLVPIAWVRAKV